MRIKPSAEQVKDIRESNHISIQEAYEEAEYRSCIKYTKRLELKPCLLILLLHLIDKIYNK